MRPATQRLLSAASATFLITGLVVAAPATALPAGAAVFDDFEDGDASDWSFFGGTAAGGGGGVLDDRPAEGSYYLSTGWGGEGDASGFYGGAFRNLDDTAQVELPDDPWFSMWVLNESGSTADEYVLELTLREDTDGDGWTDGAEDSIRLDTRFTSAEFNNTWTLLSAPLSSWTNAGTGGNGDFDGAVDEMVIVLAGVQGGPGATIEVDFDAIAFSSGPPEAASVIDDFEAGLPFGEAVPNGEPLGFYTFQGDGSVAIATESTPPAPELADVGTPNNVLQMDADVASFSGYLHAFENAAVDTWVTQDWSTREGISFWMYGSDSGTQMFIDILDNRTPGSTTDDAERFTTPFVDNFSGWKLFELPFADFVRKEIGNGAPNDGLGLFEMHGYALGTLGTGGPQTFYFDQVSVYGVAEPPALAVSFLQQNTIIEEGTTGDVVVKLSRPMGPDDPEQVSIDFATERSNAVPNEDFTPTSGTLTFINGGPNELSFEVETLDNTKFTGDKQVVIRLTNPVDIERGALFQGSVLIDDNDPFDPDLLDDFEQGAFLWDTKGPVGVDVERVSSGDAGARPGQDSVEAVGVVSQDPYARTTGKLVRDFPLGQDWTGTQSLDFWFKGDGSGDPVTVTLKDNRTPDPGPSGWDLAWADEFDDPAGTPPNPANWAYEIGDTTPDGKNGWGNEELQYYTDDPDNAQTDGNGNLVITLDEADGSQECYYGPCEFESARLITQHKAEFAYGRIESRLRVPTGGDGLWPAFWSLGTDINANPWPEAGEIDVMEYVSRIPNEIFGTIHGPGYNGGGSFSGIYDFGERVDLSYHTFAVEWEPESIKWYVDDVLYHEAVPSDVAPDPWVFEKPFFLLLNFAIGGNFGGAIDPANTYPQEYLVDYVRVYQGPDTAERFQTTFTDSSTEWQQVSIPVADFARSVEQPAGAPDDGLTLSEVWGYGFEIPATSVGGFRVDLVRRTPNPAPTELVVTNLDDSGAGSLREALARVADGGTVTFDPALAGGTVTLTSGELAIDSSVSIDAAVAAPVTVSAGGASRVIQVAAGAQVSINDLTIRDGVASPRGGGILNNGELSLERVVVTDNLENSGGAASFDLGGGGIYTGEGATLNLTDSTVSDNSTVNQPAGGVYGFLNSTITVTRSTISGNVGGDVAGGLRTLGVATIQNSTISGNTSSAWHGGALFATDGSVTIANSSIVGNNAPDGTAGGLMVATFGTPVDVSIVDSVIADNGTYSCQTEGGSAASLTSLGGNVVTDDSCAAVPSDTVVTPGAAGVAALADNGGPTLTHALEAGSPALDSASSACPSTDQRGVSRPQGSSCDVGSFEREPGPAVEPAPAIEPALKVTAPGHTRLRINLQNLADADWKVEILKRENGKYRTVRTARTQGTSDVVVVKASPGRYKVRVAAQHGYLATAATIRVLPKPTIRVSTPNNAKLRADVNPNLSGKKSWRIKVLKKTGDSFTVIASRKTAGKQEVTTVNVGRGTYRVLVPAQKGHARAVSKAVFVRR